MERVVQPRTAARRAFTLVELLVVMGIIGLLISLLIPAVNKAIVAARMAATRTVIGGLAAGLETFRADWGVYPPSDTTHSDKIQVQGLTYGYEIMAVALMGPEGKGWGAPSKSVGPFGGSATSTYGPYYERPAGPFQKYVADAFISPLRPILYFRFEPTETGSSTYLFGRYDAADNPMGNLSEGYYNQTHLEVKLVYITTDRAYRWRREDYVLVSPGPDRFFGPVKEAANQTYTAASTSDVTQGRAFYDDVTNFE